MNENKKKKFLCTCNLWYENHQKYEIQKATIKKLCLKKNWLYARGVWAGFFRPSLARMVAVSAWPEINIKTCLA